MTLIHFSTCNWCDFSRVIAKLDMIVLAIDHKMYCATFLSFCSHMTTKNDVINIIFFVSGGESENSDTVSAIFDNGSSINSSFKHMHCACLLWLGSQ